MLELRINGRPYDLPDRLSPFAAVESRSCTGSGSPLICTAEDKKLRVTCLRGVNRGWSTPGLKLGDVVAGRVVSSVTNSKTN